MKITNIKSELESRIMAMAGIIIIAIFGIIIGGVSLPYVISLFLDVIIWIVVMGITLLLKPSANKQLGWAAIVGGSKWGYNYYVALTTRQQSWFCKIPIIGAGFCGAYNVIEFLPQIFMLGINIGVVYVMLSVMKFIGETVGETK